MNVNVGFYNIHKDIGGGGPFLFFYLKYLVLTKLQEIFYRFLKFKKNFEIWLVIVGGYNRFLMGGAN